MAMTERLPYKITKEFDFCSSRLASCDVQLKTNEFRIFVFERSSVQNKNYTGVRIRCTDAHKTSHYKKHILHDGASDSKKKCFFCYAIPLLFSYVIWPQITKITHITNPKTVHWLHSQTNIDIWVLCVCT